MSQLFKLHWQDSNQSVNSQYFFLLTGDLKDDNQVTIDFIWYTKRWFIKTRDYIFPNKISHCTVGGRRGVKCSSSCGLQSCCWDYNTTHSDNVTQWSVCRNWYLGTTQETWNSVNMFCKWVFQYISQVESNFTKVEMLQLFRGKLSSEMSYFFTEDS